MSRKYVAPNVSHSFNCPHCGALADQKWFKVHAYSYKDDELPWWEVVSDIESKILRESYLSDQEKEEHVKYFKNLNTREPFIYEGEKNNSVRIPNLDISLCYSCKKLAVWVGCRISYPGFSNDLIPSDDLPPDIKLDFIEAQNINQISPRGSAALLRLCIQKLCKHLGEKGKNINEDIASLVRKGLDTKIQRALDIVRVIGNEAVHPGQIDLRDDLETANKLFTLVNIITDALITQPKMIDGLFDTIPDTKRAEIAKRDA